jgi:tetratricopeptide (TPR) repeat protein
VVTLQKTRNRMPRWLSEGISVYEERQANPTWGQRMNPRYRQMIVGGELVPVSQLSAAFLRPSSPVHLQFAYFESSLAVEYLIETYGLDILKRVLTDLSVGMPLSESLQRYIGPLDALDKEFEQYARQRAQQLAPGVTWEKPELTRAATSELADWLQKHPTNFWALRRYGKMLVAENRWKDARPVLEKFIELYPDYVGADNGYLLLARVFRHHDDTHNERAVLEKLAARADDVTEVYVRLMELGDREEDWESVVVNAERALAVNPLLPAPHRYLARAAEQMEDAERAIQCYRALLEMDPADPAELHYRLAANLHRTGQSEQARRHVLMSLEEAPRYRDAHRLLLAILAANGSQRDASQSAPRVGEAKQ